MAHEIQLWEPHAKQQEILSCAARFVGVQGGRRSGKTVLHYEDIVECAENGWAMGFGTPTYKVGGEVWRWVLSALEPIIHHVDKVEKRVEFIEFPQNRHKRQRPNEPARGVFEWWSAANDPDMGRSRSYHRFNLDEFQMMPRAMTVWEAAVQPTLIEHQGRARITGSARGRRNPLHVIYMRGQSESFPDYASFNLGTVDNPYIPRSEIKRMEREYPAARYREEVLGIPGENAENPFGIDAIRANIEGQSVGKPVWFGVDLAQSVDWTVIIGLDEDGRVAFFDRFQNLPWSSIETRVADAIGDAVALVDSTGVGKPVFERIASRCHQAEPFYFTANSKQDLINNLGTAIQTGAIGYPDGPIVDELESFEYIRKDDGKIIMTAPVGLHDDCVMALGMAYRAMTMHRAEPFVSVIPIRRRQPRIMTGAPR
jgi:hypothetical protein